MQAPDSGARGHLPHLRLCRLCHFPPKIWKSALKAVATFSIAVSARIDWAAGLKRQNNSSPSGWEKPSHREISPQRTAQRCPNVCTSDRRKLMICLSSSVFEFGRDLNIESQSYDFSRISAQKPSCTKARSFLLNSCIGADRKLPHL